MTCVVVIAGTSAGRIGHVVGPDRINMRKGARRSLVRFAGHPYPHDFRSIANDNLRAADPGEIAKAEVL